MITAAHADHAPGAVSDTCPHIPRCPAATAPDHDAARTVAAHPEQGWSLLCNGVVLFDDSGELLPGGRALPPPQASWALLGRTWDVARLHAAPARSTPAA